ncbi:carbohydrate ABC transporter permease [Naasia aerilata]|uniref:Sugar ABC transporter permease n=1 Tax=Naasia aerilata TaxID=1162966 RepID=A0ABM8GHA4_9MICO|nr:sugar ABC transporter permease [Naasia aerilata]BDZ44129.1 sugar ABC transporter permease [Naasia aerilata]BDZ47740.1 sugar ABC transporter permease [Naasia aerilata]
MAISSAAPATARVKRPASAPDRGSKLFASWWWAIPALVVSILVHYVAVAVGGTFAFTNWKGIGAFQFVGFDNFAKIFSGDLGRGAILNTLFLAFGFLIGTNVFGLLLALALNRGVKLRYFLRVVIFMPTVLSPLAVSYIWRFIYQPQGPLNSFLGSVGLESWQRTWLADPVSSIWTILIVMVWQSTGLVMVIYLAGLAGVPQELEEAAAIDGANVFQRFRHVVFPLIRPSFVIASTLMLIQGLRVFDQVMALTGGGPFNATETLATQVYKQTFAYGQFGYGAALSLVLTVLIIVISLIQMGLTSGRERKS